MQRRRLRDRSMLGATIIATLRESDERMVWTADAMAAHLHVGRGVVIAVRDELVRAGYLGREGHTFYLTAKTREGLERGDDHGEETSVRGEEGGPVQDGRGSQDEP